MTNLSFSTGEIKIIVEIIKDTITSFDDPVDSINGYSYGVQLPAYYLSKFLISQASKCWKTAVEISGEIAQLLFDLWPHYGNLKENGSSNNSCAASTRLSTIKNMICCLAFSGIPL